MTGVLKPFQIPGLWDQPKSKRAQHILDFAKANNCFVAEFGWRDHSLEPEEGETIADLDIYEHYMFNAVRKLCLQEPFANILAGGRFHRHSRGSHFKWCCVDEERDLQGPLQIRRRL